MASLGHHLKVIGIAVLALLAAPATLSADDAMEHPLVPVLQSELDLSMDKLAAPDGTNPYYLQYTVTDTKSLNISATLGAITADRDAHSRLIDVDVRCGSYELDNTHQIRGSYGGGFDRGDVASLPLNSDPVASRHAIWLHTDERFKDAVNRLAQIKANIQVKVEEEDPSDDFTKEEPQQSIDPWVEQSVDRKAWAERMRKYSEVFRKYPKIYSSSVSVSGTITNEIILNSEGSKLQFGRGWWRIGIRASTIADDGMELWQYQSFDAHSPGGMPDDAAVMQAVQEVIDDVMALRDAPIVDPYTGPAILVNRASGVFFHEIFGHRIEGHRQKDVEEGQTFAKKLGQQVLPAFLSVVDDPSQKQFQDTDLNGYYEFDQEAVPAQPARLIASGVLETFLMSRLPTRGINQSNGHGRRQPGSRVVSRQGNLIVESTKQVPFAELRSMLIEECKKQGKDFGLLFEDISGGFTTTGRRGPQAFKVLPIMVFRVYADGRPDELVRGVDIVGTPLTCFSKIVCTGNDPAIFNGVCGAESGSVPVSAISPSILVEQIEIEKKQKAQDRPPILDPPIALQDAT